MGEFPRFNSAQGITESAQSRRGGGQSSQGIGFGEASVESHTQLRAEGFAVRQCVGSQGDGQTRTDEQGRVFRSPIPGPQHVEGDRIPRRFFGELGQRRKVERHDERNGCLGHGCQEVWPSPFLTAGHQLRSYPRFGSHPESPILHQDTTGFEDHWLGARSRRVAERRLERSESCVELGPWAGAGTPS